MAHAVPVAARRGRAVDRPDNPPALIKCQRQSLLIRDVYCMRAEDVIAQHRDGVVKAGGSVLRLRHVLREFERRMKQPPGKHEEHAEQNERDQQLDEGEPAAKMVWRLARHGFSLGKASARTSPINSRELLPLVTVTRAHAHWGTSLGVSSFSTRIPTPGGGVTARPLWRLVIVCSARRIASRESAR